MAGDYRAYSGSAMSAAKKRFKASGQSQANLFMMIELDKEKTGAAKMFEGATFGLAQIHKDSGEIIDVIDMAKEKEPSYAIDPLTETIFYRLDNKSIISYKF